MKLKRKLLAILMAFAMLIGGVPMGLLTVDAESVHSCGDKNNCNVCIMADMINALPDAEEINIDNAASVVAQIHAIDRIKGNLSENEYDEMIQMVEAGNDGSGYGVDIPLRYKEALEAVNKINAGGRLAVSKLYEVGDENLDWSASDASLKIERLDGSSFEPLTVTLSDILVPTVGYQAESNGWTNTYPLPAGTYKITEINYNAVTTDGKQLTTTPTCSFDGQEGRDSAVVTIGNGEEQSLYFTNTYTPTLMFEAHHSTEDGALIPETIFQLVDNQGSFMTEKISDNGECEINITDTRLDENVDYTMIITHGDYHQKEFTFRFNYGENGFALFDGAGNELDPAAIKIALTPIDKYIVYPVSGEVEYGDSLDSFVDFERTTLNGQKITDAQEKETLIDYLGYTLKDKDGNPYELYKISTLPVGEYTMLVEKKYSNMPGITINGPATIKIIPREINASDFNVTAKDKEYDETTAAELEAIVADSVLAADINAGKVELNISGEFENADPGVNKAVEFTIALAGAGASNYAVNEGGIKGSTTATISFDDSNIKYIPDQDGDGKPEVDSDGDGIYEGTADDKTYIPDQDGDGKPEVDDNNDQIFDNENDDKHYVPDGNGGFTEYFFTYKVSDDVLTWTLGGTEDMTYTVDGPVEKFEGLELDGTVVDENNYSYVSGSTIITLKASYLNSLSAGEYPLVAEYVDGSGKTTLKIVAATTPGGGEGSGGNVAPGGDADGTTGADSDKDSASDTGDNASPFIWFMIMMAAAGAAVVTRKVRV